MPFELLPAIDLRAGRVVRLVRGDFGAETVYGTDPAEVARRFAADGARWIHVVDLDGARAGAPRQAAAVARVVRAAGEGTACEVAGGLRTAEAVDAALATGARRVVLGTAALQDPAFAAMVIERHGAGRVAVALDVRDGLALGEGWRAGAVGVRAEDALRALGGVGVTTFEVTAIERDGLLGGPDLGLLGRLVALGLGEVVASGGVGSLEDVLAVRALGCAGAIVGRALYEGRLGVRAALAAIADEASA